MKSIIDLLFFPWSNGLNHTVLINSGFMIILLIIELYYTISKGWTEKTIKKQLFIEGAVSSWFVMVFCYWYFALLLIVLSILLKINESREDALFYYFLENNGYNRENIKTNLDYDSTFYEKYSQFKKYSDKKDVAKSKKYIISVKYFIFGIIIESAFFITVVLLVKGYKYLP